MRLKRIVALSLSLTMLLSINVFAEVPPQNDIVGSGAVGTLSTNTTNIEAWSLEAQELSTAGLHKHEKVVLNSAGFTGGYDNSFYETAHFKTAKKYTDPEEDWSLLITAFTGGAVLAKSSAHIHAGMFPDTKGYETIDSATENGCKSYVKMTAMNVDLKKLAELGDDATISDIPTSNAEVEKWLAEFVVENGSVIYMQVECNGVIWYALAAYDPMEQADDGLTAPIKAGALRISKDNVTIIMFESQELVDNQSTLGARYTDVMNDVMYTIATYK